MVFNYQFWWLSSFSSSLSDGQTSDVLVQPRKAGVSVSPKVIDSNTVHPDANP